MTARKKPPRLTLGPITGRIYIVTRYTERADGIVEAHEKFDCTNEFLTLYAEATRKFTYTPRLDTTDAEQPSPECSPVSLSVQEGQGET